MAVVQHAINGGLVECDDETAKVLIESTMWVAAKAAPVKKAAAAKATVKPEG